MQQQGYVWFYVQQSQQPCGSMCSKASSRAVWFCRSVLFAGWLFQAQRYTAAQAMQQQYLSPSFFVCSILPLPSSRLLLLSSPPLLPAITPLFPPTGSLKGEHGTGRNVAPFVEMEWGTKATELMWELKQLFDPDFVLNPGVILNRWVWVWVWASLFRGSSSHVFWPVVILCPTTKV
jgi:hypothetical protein